MRNFFSTNFSPIFEQFSPLENRASLSIRLASRFNPTRVAVQSDSRRGSIRIASKFNPNRVAVQSKLRRGPIQRKVFKNLNWQIIHILWIRVLPPPPLSTSAKVNNIHTKEFFYPHSVTPPLALIHFYQNL